MPKQNSKSSYSRLTSVHFFALKSLTDVTIELDAPLTAIMGVNGAGKSTVIHALACVYKQAEGHEGNLLGEHHIFPDFFRPSTGGIWSGSKFVANFSSDGGETSRVYEKRDIGGLDTILGPLGLLITSASTPVLPLLRKPRIEAKLSIRLKSEVIKPPRRFCRQLHIFSTDPMKLCLSTQAQIAKWLGWSLKTVLSTLP